ncbi:MAG: NUDIX domain-containing protein [Erysipelotrichaceae bacterium]|nr:NUDIX domain-containing protein [Erysipelotrichaceae bacterium]
MKYCFVCGTGLIRKELKNEGKIPYCPACEEYRFPVYNVAVSMEVMSPDRSKVLLIQQYGKEKWILVAGYVNRREKPEQAVVREVKEETGLDVTSVTFNSSEFYEKSNTLMLNFSCIATSENISSFNREEVDRISWFSWKVAEQTVYPDSLAHHFLKEWMRKEGHL